MSIIFIHWATVYVKYLESTTGHRLCAESCPTLCSLLDCSLSDSSVHGISQARNWNGLPFPSPGDLPDPGIKLTSPALAGRFFTTEPPGMPAHFLAIVLKCVCLVFSSVLGPILPPNWESKLSETLSILLMLSYFWIPQCPTHRRGLIVFLEGGNEKYAQIHKIKST